MKLGHLQENRTGDDDVKWNKPSSDRQGQYILPPIYTLYFNLRKAHGGRNYAMEKEDTLNKDKNKIVNEIQVQENRRDNLCGKGANKKGAGGLEEINGWIERHKNQIEWHLCMNVS